MDDVRILNILYYLASSIMDFFVLDYIDPGWFIEWQTIFMWKYLSTYVNDGLFILDF